MRWGDMRPSDNVEDRRGGGGGSPVRGGMRLGGGALIVVVIVSLLFGVNPMQFLGMMEDAGPVVAPPPPAQPTPAGEAPAAAAKDPEGVLVKRTLGDTEDVWSAVFKTMGPRRLAVMRSASRSTVSRHSTVASSAFSSSSTRCSLSSISGS